MSRRGFLPSFKSVDHSFQEKKGKIEFQDDGHLGFPVGTFKLYSQNIERLSKLQKRAARIILQAEFRTPSATMFQELGWLTIPKRLIYNKAILTYKALNNMTPIYITKLLKPMSIAHERSLRSSSNGLLSVPRSRTALYDRSFSHSASRLWNSMPTSLRTTNSLNEFKTSLKQYL